MLRIRWQLWLKSFEGLTGLQVQYGSFSYISDSSNGMPRTDRSLSVFVCVSQCTLSMWASLHFLTTWRSLGSWTSYTVAWFSQRDCFKPRWKLYTEK